MKLKSSNSEVKAISDRFGLQISILGIILAIFLYVRDKKSDITYDIMSVSSVFNVQESVNQLKISYRGIDLEKKKKDLVLITLRVINSGETNILSQQFDEQMDWGFSLDKCDILETGLLNSSSDYISQRMKVRSDANKVIFTKIVFDKGAFFTTKILVIVDKNVVPVIKPTGKVAGIDEFTISESYDRNKGNSFKKYLESVFEGNYLVQGGRLISYFICMIFTVFFISTLYYGSKKAFGLVKLRSNAITIGNMGSLKAALSIYYGDHEGKWPSSIYDLVPDYLERIPDELIKNKNTVVELYDGNGGWVYDKSNGIIGLNVDGKDQKGVEYRSYHKVF